MQCGVVYCISAAAWPVVTAPARSTHQPALQKHNNNISTYQHINIPTYQHHGPGDPPAADRQHAGAGEDGEVAPVPLHTGVSTEYSVTGSHLDIAIKCKNT